MRLLRGGVGFRRRPDPNASVFSDIHVNFLRPGLFCVDELIGEEIEQDPFQFANAEAAHFFVRHERAQNELGRDKMGNRGLLAAF
jgi:hypothetical protein